MNTNLLYIIIIASLWAICPHLDRLVLEEINHKDYWIISRFWLNGLVILFIISFIYIKKFDLRKNVKKISNKAWFYAILATLIGNITLLMNYYVIHRAGVIESTSILSPLVVLITILYGYFIFGESINRYQIFGTILALTGMYLIIANSKKLN